MITIILCVILCVIAFNKSIDEWEWDWSVTGVVGGVLLGLPAGFIAAMFIGSIRTPYLPQESSVEHELVQIADQAYPNTHGYMHGSFFLALGYASGSASTDLEQSFTFYQKNGDNYTLESAPADKSVIRYTNDQPKVVYETAVCVWGENGGPKLDLWGFESCDTSKQYDRYIFYIPEGSIKANYELGGKE